jgi:hypothetical protein
LARLDCEAKQPREDPDDAGHRRRRQPRGAEFVDQAPHVGKRDVADWARSELGLDVLLEPLPVWVDGAL